MNPCLEINHIGHCSGGYQMIACELVYAYRSCFKLISALLYNLLGKLGPMSLFSALPLLPSFVNHIPRILLSCSKKQVERVNALWVVAFVANKQSFRNITTRKKPCHSWSVNNLPAGEHKTPNTCANIGPIFLRKYPTTFGCCQNDLRPKTLPCSGLNKLLSYESIESHNQIVWLCHALGRFNVAGALSLSWQR